MATTRRAVGAMLGVVLALAAFGSPAHGQETGADEAGVRRAALDYLEGFYEGDDAKLRRSVHPQVDKFGFARSGPEGPYRRVPMSFDEMFAFTESVRNGRNLPPEGAPREVSVLDVQDQIAVAKVTAWWGSDYLQMARYDGRWKIVHVLWQSPPPP